MGRLIPAGTGVPMSRCRVPKDSNSGGVVVATASSGGATHALAPRPMLAGLDGALDHHIVGDGGVEQRGAGPIDRVSRRHRHRQQRQHRRSRLRNRRHRNDRQPHQHQHHLERHHQHNVKQHRARERLFELEVKTEEIGEAPRGARRGPSRPRRAPAAARGARRRSIRSARRPQRGPGDLAALA